MIKKIKLLDGSLSYPIESRGHGLNSKLWTAKILIDNPKVIEDIHVEYINSGVDYISTSSYQLSVKTLKAEGYNISEIENKIRKNNPYPPFITSTLQLDASNKLGFSPSRTMTLAQK